MSGVYARRLGCSRVPGCAGPSGGDRGVSAFIVLTYLIREERSLVHG